MGNNMDLPSEVAFPIEQTWIMRIVLPRPQPLARVQPEIGAAACVDRPSIDISCGLLFDAIPRLVRVYPGLCPLPPPQYIAMKADIFQRT